VVPIAGVWVSATPGSTVIAVTTKQKLILTLLLGSQFMLSIDFSILNVALPAIGRDLRISAADLPWVATAFSLPSAGFTLLFGRLGDLLGRRRLFLAGLALLAAGSLAGGLAPSAGVLLGARFAQGLAAALAIPSALGLLTTSFPEGPLRERALGLNGSLLAGGFTVGALLGGVLTGFLTWRWAFLINVPIALAIAITAPAVIAESRHPQRPRLDVPGAVTVTTGLLALVSGVTMARQDGWGSGTALGTLATSAVLLGAFFAIERRSRAPLAPVAILARPTVKWGNLGGLTIFSMGSSVVYLMTLYLQGTLGYSPLVTGLAFAVPGVAAVVAGTVAPRIIGRIGTRATLTGGIAVQGAGFATLLALGTQRAWLALVLAALGVAFFGHVSGIVAYTITATSGLPGDEQGLATGLTTMTQLVALTIGIPVIGAVAGGASLSGLHRGLLADVAANAAFAAVVWVGLRDVGARQHQVAAREGGGRPGHHDGHPGPRAEGTAEPATGRPAQVHDDRAGLVGQVVDDLLQARDVPETLRVEEQQRHHDGESEGLASQNRGDPYGQRTDEHEVQAGAEGSRHGAGRP
jgi:MFS family permease